MFGPELIQINNLLMNELKLRKARFAPRGFFFCGVTAEIWKQDISSVSEKAFPGFFGDIFGCSTLFKKRCLSTQEFTRFLSAVSSQHQTMRSDVSFQI